MALQDIIGKLQNVKPEGNEIRANCPACGDTKRHLYLTAKEDGQVLLHCKKGCDADSVLSAIGLKRSDLFANSNQGESKPAPKCVKKTTWDIVDTNGTVVAQHIRLDFEDGSKKFVWYRNGVKGLGGIKTANLPLYGSQWLENHLGEDITLVEGEKTADALIGSGRMALGTVTGANNCPSDEVLKILVGWQGKIILWPDNDDVGKQHMQKISEVLHMLDVETWMIDWPDAPESGDAYDFIKANGDLVSLYNVIRRVSVYCLGQTDLRLKRDKNGTLTSPLFRGCDEATVSNCPGDFENTSKVSRFDDFDENNPRLKRDRNGTENGTNDQQKTENGTVPSTQKGEKTPKMAENGTVLTAHFEKFSARIVDWIKGTTGWWETRELDSDLGVSSLRDKENRKKVLQRLKERGVIESHPKINKQWRYVNDRATSLNFKTATNSGVLNFKWPLEIEKYVNLYPGNMAVIAGAPNSGKTALMLNLIYLNQQYFPVYYFCSEMGAVELRSRLELFPGMGINDWKFEAIERASEFADVIRPDCVNIIDFLEMTTELYLVNTYLTAINQKLKSGIAIVALQKKVGAAFGRGLEFGLEKPKLYLSMDKGKMQIVKGKSWAQKNVDPSGLQTTFKIVDGCKFQPTSNWDWPK
jgi:hypothetical protein